MSDWNYAEWAEKAGAEHLKHRLVTGDTMLAQANTLLSLLLIGIGGGLSYAMKIAGDVPVGRMEWGAAAATTWLVWVAAVLVHQCIATRGTSVPGNSPLNIYKPDLNLSEEEVRAFNMEIVRDQIAFTQVRNASVAHWLDSCRYAALATPIVFTIAAWVVPG